VKIPRLFIDGKLVILLNYQRNGCISNKDDRQLFCDGISVWDYKKKSDDEKNDQTEIQLEGVLVLHVGDNLINLVYSFVLVRSSMADL